MIEELLNYKNIFIVFTIISVITFILSIVFIPFLFINLSPDYFKQKRQPLINYKNSFLRYLALIIKNILGYIIIILGILMLFIPGQGLLSIIIGILLVNFPGKKKLEYYFFTNKKISSSINVIRRRAGKEEINFKYEN